MSFILTRIRLKDFRNHERFEILPHHSSTILVGPNAVGKTNVLEAVQLVTEATSFRAPLWKDVVRWGASSAVVQAEASGTDRRTRRVTLTVTAEGERRYVVDGKKKSPAAVAGTIPCVLFTPDDLRIVKESAQRRRNAIDDLGVQLSRAYAQLRREYERVVRQRNALLKRESAGPEALRALDEVLVATGTALMRHRKRLLERIAGAATRIYARIAEDGPLELTYVPSWERTSRPASRCEEVSVEEACTEELFRYHLERMDREERSRQMTLVGPHRDDVKFALCGRELRTFGSQGQQRSAALAFKLAEVEVVEDVTGGRPVLLLDDVMSELDEARRKALLDTVGVRTQTLITATTLAYFPRDVIDDAVVVRMA